MTTLISAPRTAWLRASDGHVETRGEEWLEPVTTSDERALRCASPPVLDIGCGPGRHVVALAERGIPALGIDITPIALTAARARGALVLERSVFDRVPASGRWRSALLLDGNVGIGGDPARLLRRVVTLLCAGGRIVVEVAVGAPRVPVRVVRLELARAAGPWFRWARVTADDLVSVAARVGLDIVETWHTHDGRSFACLETSTCARER